MDKEKELIALQIYSISNYSYDYLAQLSLEELEEIYIYEMSKLNGKNAKE